MYQVLAYALRRECAKVILIYPYFEAGATEKARFNVPSDLLIHDVLIEAVTIDVITEDIGQAIPVMTGRLETAIEMLSG
jgi:hypothetical protein